MPTIIKDMGYKTTTAQLMTIPVYCTAAVITIGTSYAADKLRLRSPFLIACYFLELLGFALCVTAGGPARTYAGLFLVACGTYPATPACITILSNNLAGSYKRAVGIAIALMGSALGGAMACNFYRKQDAPNFVLGHAINIGFVCLGLSATCFWVWNYQRINRQRDGRLGQGEHLRSTTEELSLKGDKAVTFKYTL
jgi:MFS family permease